MLVGDSAGFADPLSGEGIYYALKSGELAAKSCFKALRSGRHEYERECWEAFGLDLKIARKIALKFYGSEDRVLKAIKPFTRIPVWKPVIRDERGYRKMMSYKIARAAAKTIKKII